MEERYLTDQWVARCSSVIGLLPPQFKDITYIVKLPGPAVIVGVAAAELVPDAFLERLPFGDFECPLRAHLALIKELCEWRERLIQAHLSLIPVLWELTVVQQAVD